MSTWSGGRSRWPRRPSLRRSTASCGRCRFGDRRSRICWFGGHSRGERVFTGSSGEPLKLHGLSQSFLKFRRMACLDEEISFHSLRHSCATNLLDLGAPITVVQRYLGHRDVKTTMRYVRPSAEKVDFWIERVMG